MAKIKATCPFCGAENRYDATAAGLHVSCAECSGRYQLDYAKAPRRGCLSSCLTAIVAVLLLGAGGALVAYYFHVPLPLLEDEEIAKEAAPRAPQPAPAPIPESPPQQEPRQDVRTPPEIALVPAPEPSPPEYALRTWVDNSGSFNVRASLLDVTDGQVHLEKENKEIIAVPVEKLSKIDRNYLFEMLGERFDPRFQHLTGKVIDVSTGDTLTLRDDTAREHTIRLAGIDAPEPGQEYADEARQALAEMVLGASVTVQWQDREPQGAIVGVVLLESRSVNLAMLNQGWAWHHEPSGNDPELQATERLAQDLRRGLWASDNPQPPWEHANQ